MMPPKKILILHGMMIFLLLFATRSHAQDNPPPESWLKIDELRFGLLAHDVDKLWSGSRKESGADFNMEFIFHQPAFSVAKGIARPNVGLSINHRGQTSKLYGGILWEICHPSGGFLDLGLGVAVHNGELRDGDSGKKLLGSRVLFRIPIEFGMIMGQHHRVSLAFDHISNAYLSRPNHGMDTLGLRYGYVF